MSDESIYLHLGIEQEAKPPSRPFRGISLEELDRAIRLALQENEQVNDSQRYGQS